MKLGLRQQAMMEAWSWECMPRGKVFTFLLIFLYFKTKQIKRTLCQEKYICGPEPDSLQSLKQSLSSQGTFRGEWSGYEITHNHAVCETTE